MRGRIPWYGTLVNHAGTTLPAVAAGSSVRPSSQLSRHPETERLAVDFVATVVGGDVLFVLNTVIASGVVALRTGQSFIGCGCW